VFLNWTAYARSLRNQVVNDINELKPGRSRRFKLLAVALTKTALSDARVEARERGYQYIISVQLYGSDEPTIIAYQLQKVSDDTLISNQIYPSAPAPAGTATWLVNSLYRAIAKASTP
jgi:hypothetical protein